MSYGRKLLAHILFYIGHGLSVLMNLPYLSWLYRTYNWCMGKSIQLHPDMWGVLPNCSQCKDTGSYFKCDKSYGCIEFICNECEKNPLSRKLYGSPK